MTDTPFDDINIKDTQETVKKLTGISSKKAKEKEGFFMGAHGYKNKVVNIVRLIESDDELNGLFRFNDFIGELEYNRTPTWNERIKEGKKIEDTDEIYIKGLLAEKYHFEPPRGLIAEALFLSASKNRVHPVKDYLESLEWDGKKRLNKWLKKVCGADDNIYTETIGRKLICSMVKRIYYPGCQFDNLIVLEGKQGIYKTTMLRILGGEWYAPFSIKADSKDAVDVMQGKWLLEMEELTAMRYGEVEHIKAFLSRTVDRVRLSYRRNAQDFPRQCIFIGTMNPIGDNQYFRDPSENRRFWPIECNGTIKIDWIKEWRDQLFAEAMTVYKEEKLFLDNGEALKISLDKQDSRKPQDSWIENIEEYLVGKNVVTPNEIMTKCLHCEVSKISHSNLSRVGICMRQLGWYTKQKGKEKRKYYVRPGIDINQENTGIEQINWNEEE